MPLTAHKLAFMIDYGPEHKRRHLLHELEKLPTEELRQVRYHPNEYVRDTANETLIDRGDRDTE
jgi:hypothetical protein